MTAIIEYVKKYIVGTRHEWESHFENIIYLFDKNLDAFKPQLFLDVGCGNGERTIRTAQYFHIDLSKTHGIDYDEAQVAECSRFFNANKTDLETEAIPYPEDTFDLTVCNQVLEHLKNYQRALSEVIRVTKKGGDIVIGIPNLAHLINRIYLLFRLQPMCMGINSNHIRGFTHKAFTQMLQTVKNVKLIDSAGSLMYPLPYPVATYLSRLLVGLSGFTCYLLQKTED